MRILIVANHFPVCSARYAADAFTRLGHEVRHVGQPMGRNIWGVDVPAEYVWTPDKGYDTPDLVIVMDSDPSILDAPTVNPLQIPCVVWGVDNHCRDYRRPYFDHYFLAHKSVSVMTWASKVITEQTVETTPNDDMTWLPCAYDPIAFPPSPIPWADREYDVCCLGVMTGYPKRWELVNAMKTAGLRVIAGCGMVYDQYRDIHHNSRVALVSSFNGDLPIRLFEGAGMGCAVICDPIPDLETLDPLAPMPRYLDVEWAVNLAQSMVVNGESSGRYAAEWAASHTWDARAQVIVDWFAARNGGAA